MGTLLRGANSNRGGARPIFKALSSLARAKPWSPRRKRIRSKRKLSPIQKLEVPTPSEHRDLPRPPPRSVVLMPITEGIQKARKQLSRFSIASVLDGQTSEAELMVGLSSMLGTQIVEVTPFGNRQFEVSFKMKKYARTAEELSPFRLNGKYDPCTIGLAKRSPEIGSIGSDAACWITLTNLPLHCWSHGSIIEIVRAEQLSDFLWSLFVLK